MGPTYAKAGAPKAPTIEKAELVVDTSVVVASAVAVSLYNVAFGIVVAVGV